MAYYARETDFVKHLMNKCNKKQLACDLRDEMEKKENILDFVLSRLQSMSSEDKRALAKVLVDSGVMDWEIHKSDEELDKAIANYKKEKK